MEINKIGGFYVGNVRNFNYMPGAESEKFASAIYYSELPKTGKTVVITEYAGLRMIAATK